MRQGLAIAFGMAAGLLVGTLAAAQGTPRAVAAKLKNPVAVTPASIATGNQLYQKQCRLCHGAAGKAETAAAKAMGASDLTDGTWTHGGSDGEIFAVIMDGGGPDSKMKGFKGKLSDQDAWHVVNYVRSLAAK